MAYQNSSEIITRVRDRISDPSAVIFSANEMNRHLSAVITEYSGYNPYMTSTTITTVVDQSLYTLPSGCLWLSRVYVASADNDVSDTIDDILLDIRENLDNYDLSRLRTQLRERYSNYGQPVATWWNAQLYLHPAPTTAGDTITVEYGGLHSVNSAGNYTTIPVDHIMIVEDMLVCRCLQAMAVDAALRVDYSDGQARVTSSRMAENLQKMATVLRQQVDARLSSPVGMIA